MRELAAGRCGIEMCVMGDECCDGSSRSSEAKEFQYFCSDVVVDGPFGSLIGCRGCTSAAMVSVVEGFLWSVKLFARRDKRTFELFWWSSVRAQR